jgi:hypothetical protein
MKRKLPVVLRVCLAICLAASFCFRTEARSRQQTSGKEVIFFDVNDLPARIDEPKFSQNKEFRIDCAVANRAGERLLGIRLILLVTDPTGRLRGRITWTERAQIEMYSIKTLTFHPEIAIELRRTDQLFLGIDEVFGSETIWRAAGAEKALRAFSRGQHAVVPAVRTFANKYDPKPGLKVIPLEQKE